jgi:hypothetical protein
MIILGALLVMSVAFNVFQYLMANHTIAIWRGAYKDLYNYHVDAKVLLKEVLDSARPVSYKVTQLISPKDLN